MHHVYFKVSTSYCTYLVQTSTSHGKLWEEIKPAGTATTSNNSNHKVHKWIENFYKNPYTKQECNDDTQSIREFFNGIGTPKIIHTEDDKVKSAL